MLETVIFWEYFEENKIVFPAGMNLTVHTKIQLYEKFGHIFYNITGVQVNFQISGLKLRLHNLFNGSPLLGEFRLLIEC